MEPPSTNTDELASRLQALPRELYAAIYDLTFGTSPDTVIVDKSYKPPSTLHVSRESRAHFAKLYFSQATFRFAFRFEGCRDVNLWASAFEMKHLAEVCSNGYKLYFEGQASAKQCFMHRYLVRVNEQYMEATDSWRRPARR